MRDSPLYFFHLKRGSNGQKHSSKFLSASRRFELRGSAEAKCAAEVVMALFSIVIISTMADSQKPDSFDSSSLDSKCGRLLGYADRR